MQVVGLCYIGIGVWFTFFEDRAIYLARQFHTFKSTLIPHSPGFRVAAALNFTGSVLAGIEPLKDRVLHSPTQAGFAGSGRRACS